MSVHHSEIMQALGRIEQKIDSHMVEDREVHTRHEKAIAQNTDTGQANSKTIARIRGWGAGVSAVLGIVLAGLGLDRFGG